MGEYERLVGIRLALEKEINTYRSILEDEEKRIRRVSRKFSKNISSGGRGLADITDSSGVSSSDQEGPSATTATYRSVDSTDGTRRAAKSSYSYSSSSKLRTGRN